MSKPMEGGNAVNRIKQLVGGAQKYWNLPTSGSFRFSERNRDKVSDAFHTSCSTFSERFRNHESSSSLLTGLQKSGSSRSNRGEGENDESDIPSGHLEDFFEVLATMLVHERRTSGRSPRSFNKEIKEAVTALAQSPIDLDSHLPNCAASREQMAQRKARIVAAKLREEFSTCENPTTEKFIVPDMVETSESSMSRSSLTGNRPRSSSRRRSIARARRLSNCAVVDDGTMPDFPENSINRRPSSSRTRNQSSRSRTTQPHMSAKDDTEQIISSTIPRKASLHRKSLPHSIDSVSPEESSPSRRFLAIRRRTRPDLDLAVNDPRTPCEVSHLQPERPTSCDSSKTDRYLWPLTASTALRKGAAGEKERNAERPKKRGGLQRTSPSRRRASADAPSQNSLQQSDHNLHSRLRTRVGSKCLSKSDHLPSSVVSLQDSGNKLNKILRQKTNSSQKSLHASSIGLLSNNKVKIECNLHQSALWEKPVPFVVNSNSNNPFQSTFLFEDESLADAFFAESDHHQASDSSKVPRSFDLPKSDLITHPKTKRGSISSRPNAPPCSPVARRMMRRAQALYSTPPAACA